MRALVQCHDHGTVIKSQPQQQHSHVRLSFVLGELQRRCYSAQKTTKSKGGRESDGSDSDSDSDSDDEKKSDRVCEWMIR